ncbi:hypothetical protein ACWF82_29325 [Nocardia sp. NPDC055053]
MVEHVCPAQPMRSDRISDLEAPNKAAAQGLCINPIGSFPTPQAGARMKQKPLGKPVHPAAI